MTLDDKMVTMVPSKILYFEIDANGKSILKSQQANVYDDGIQVENKGSKWTIHSVYPISDYLFGDMIQLWTDNQWFFPMPRRNPTSTASINGGNEVTFQLWKLVPEESPHILKPLQARGKIFEDFIEGTTGKSHIFVYHSIYPITAHYTDGILRMWEYKNNLYPLPKEMLTPTHKRLTVIPTQPASLEDSLPLNQSSAPTKPVPLTPDRQMKKEFHEMLEFYVQWKAAQILMTEPELGLNELMRKILKTYTIDEWATGSDALAKAADDHLLALIRYDNGEPIFSLAPSMPHELPSDIAKTLLDFEAKFASLRKAVREMPRTT